MDSIWENRKKSKNCCFLAIFGLILAMFLTSQPYDFDAFAHAGAPLGVEWLCKISWKSYKQFLRNLKFSWKRSGEKKQHDCISSRKFFPTPKNWSGENLYFWEKKSQCRKKLKGGPFVIFQHPFCRKTANKLNEGPFGEIFFPKKVLQCQKKIGKGDPLVSPGMVCYAGKQEKPLWISSLDQIVQFGAIIFCRSFENYFGQFVWIEKKPL